MSAPDEKGPDVPRDSGDLVHVRTDLDHVVEILIRWMERQRR